MSRSSRVRVGSAAAALPWRVGPSPSQIVAHCHTHGTPICYPYRFVPPVDTVECAVNGDRRVINKGAGAWARHLLEFFGGRILVVKNKKTPITALNPHTPLSFLCVH